MEGFPKSQRPSESEKDQSPAEGIVPPAAIERVVDELNKRKADIDPVITSEYSLSPEKAEDLSETLKDIGAK